MYHQNKITYHMACCLHDHYTDRIAAATTAHEKQFCQAQLNYYQKFIDNF